MRRVLRYGEILEVRLMRTSLNNNTTSHLIINTLARCSRDAKKTDGNVLMSLLNYRHVILHLALRINGREIEGEEREGYPTIKASFNSEEADFIKQFQGLVNQCSFVCYSLTRKYPGQNYVCLKLTILFNMLE